MKETLYGAKKGCILNMNSLKDAIPMMLKIFMTIFLHFDEKIRLNFSSL